MGYLPSMLGKEQKIHVTDSPEATRALAKDWAFRLKPGAVLALAGDLGSGKTCFVQGLAEGLGVPAKAAVTSPTFVLIHEYPGGRLPLYHFDFYRLERRQEAIDLHLEEYWDSNGVSVVEWADKFAALFPERTQWIHFKVLSENEREIRC